MPATTDSTYQFGSSKFIAERLDLLYGVGITNPIKDVLIRRLARFFGLQRLTGSTIASAILSVIHDGLWDNLDLFARQFLGNNRSRLCVDGLELERIVDAIVTDETAQAAVKRHFRDNPVVSYFKED